MHPAQFARQQKEMHPALYCEHCLYKTGGGNCPRHKPRQKAVRFDELCRVELVSEIKSDDGSHAVATYRSNNVNATTCDIIVTQGPLGTNAFCIQHNRSDDCEGAARVICALDFRVQGITRPAPLNGASTSMMAER